MISKFFIERPVLSNVIAILMILIGGVSLFELAVAQYPDVVPPTVQVTTRYPGASAQDRGRYRGAADRAAGQRRRGHALHAVLQRRRRHLHADRDLQDRHRSQLRAGAGAEPRLERAVATAAGGAEPGRHGPEEVDLDPAVRHADLAGLADTTASISATTPPSICRDELSRLPGVGNVTVFGAGQYSMRIWLDPNKLQARGLMPQDVIQAIQQQSQQVTAGQVGTPPTPPGQAFQVTLNVNGRLDDASQFENIIVKTGNNGDVTRVRDVGSVELGAQTYSQIFSLNNQPADRHRRLPVARRQRARGRAGGREEDGGAGAQTSRKASDTTRRSTPPNSSTPRSTRSTRP